MLTAVLEDEVTKDRNNRARRKATDVPYLVHAAALVPVPANVEP
jgi:hypothetical protein